MQNTQDSLDLFDGLLEYIPDYLDRSKADQLLEHCLRSLPWGQEIVPMFGKTYVAPRLSCAVADEGCTYRYRGSQMAPIRFSGQLNSIRESLVSFCGEPLNYVLATRYRDGSDYVGWHADDERDLVPEKTIVNLSLGATRTFRVRTRETSVTKSIETQKGSLLLMHGNCQLVTKHMLVRTRKPVGERVVLSFRQVI